MKLFLVKIVSQTQEELVGHPKLPLMAKTCETKIAGLIMAIATNKNGNFTQITINNLNFFLLLIFH